MVQVLDSRGYRPISLRFITSQLNQLDSVIANLAEESGIAPNRSEVVAALSAARAKQLLEGSVVPLLQHALPSDEEESTTLSVVFTSEQEAVVREACAGLNQKFSPFVSWAVQTYVENLK